jgi:hypothetical protein
VFRVLENQLWNYRDSKPAFDQSKYYLSNDCSAWRTEEYEIEDLAYLKKEYEKYTAENG